MPSFVSSPGSQPRLYGTNLDLGSAAQTSAYASAGLVVSRTTLAPYLAAALQTV